MFTFKTDNKIIGERMTDNIFFERPNDKHNIQNITARPLKTEKINPRNKTDIKSSYVLWNGFSFLVR